MVQFNKIPEVEFNKIPEVESHVAAEPVRLGFNTSTRYANKPKHYRAGFPTNLNQNSNCTNTTRIWWDLVQFDPPEFGTIRFRC